MFSDLLLGSTGLGTDRALSRDGETVSLADHFAFVDGRTALVGAFVSSLARRIVEDNRVAAGRDGLPFGAVWFCA